VTVAVVEAPAKLTLSLRITGVRADGYHLLDAEMVTLDWHDTLTIDPSGSGLSVDGPFGDGVPLDDSNLVARALRAVNRRAHVHIHKALPHGGGLGGGSADAGAVLRWAGSTDVAVAASLGADVPFCVVGGRARVTGIGEVVEPIPYEPLNVTLVVPPLAVSTPVVYRTWDELGGPHSGTGNDLEVAALAAYPELRSYRDRIASACGEPPSLAGSGSTWFVPDHHDLAAALDDCTVIQTRTSR
jgi:4-diphosphocytidyl-2-C-methyl-D-erythritol kinase